jgi:hypothetical protein
MWWVDVRQPYRGMDEVKVGGGCAGGGRRPVRGHHGGRRSSVTVQGVWRVAAATSNEQRAVAAYNLLGCGIISKGFAASEGEGGGG